MTFATRGAVPTASLADTLALTKDVLLPTLAKGPIIRRKRVMAMAERLDLVCKAVRRMQRLHDAYGDGPRSTRRCRTPRKRSATPTGESVAVDQRVITRPPDAAYWCPSN